VFLQSHLHFLFGSGLIEELLVTLPRPPSEAAVATVPEQRCSVAELGSFPSSISLNRLFGQAAVQR